MNILHNQSFLDIAIQHTGSVESAFVLALQNNKSLTDELESGGSLIADSKQLIVNKDILSYYQSKNIQPATAINNQLSTINDKPEGIDYWAIQMDFIVS